MKKLTLSVLAVVFASAFSFGQLRELDNGGVPNEDKISGSRMDQHEAFLDGEYRFPAKPRNMWTFGIEGGYDQINGDVRPEFGWDIGANFRKALGYATSIRFGANYMRPQGMDKTSSPSYLIGGSTKYNRANIINLGYGEQATYIHSFEQTAILPYLEFVLNLNNINFHREQTKWGFELSAGPAAYMWQTETTFNNVKVGGAGFGTTYPDIDLGHSDDTREDGFAGDNIVIPALTSSLSLSYRASSRVAISARPRFTFTWDDWLDGEAYDDTGMGIANSDYSPNKDQNFAMNLGIDFALGNKDKRVQPLWWENPLNFTYPYLQDAYEFDDEYLFEDSDGDGVVDRLDKEPDSPCSFVDGGGVAIDSDKDGIVDCNDACPFTPAAVRSEIDENGCTPVVDKHCCDEIDELRRLINQRPTTSVSTCETKRYASVTFPENSKTIPASQNSTIAGIAATLNEDPSCRIVLEGFATGRRKVAQQVAWARANAVAKALVDNYGISRNRLVIRYSGVEGYGDIVIVRPARYDEVGTGNTAPPAPGTTY